MSETPVSPLRQRMLEDMTVRELGPATQKACVRQGPFGVSRPLAGHRPVSSATPSTILPVEAIRSPECA
jgi:hypothetical protein